MILRGDSGSGKSTFLDTVGLFRTGVVTERIVADDDLREALQALEPSSDPRIVVLEGREALGEVSSGVLEQGLHAINAFVRTDAGRGTLVVWPTNTDELTVLLVDLARKLGDDALFGVGESVERFDGPAKEQYIGIAGRTVAALNESASLAALGVSEERAIALVDESTTIGRYLALIRGELNRNAGRVKSLNPAEQPRVWTVVIAGNDPDADVAALNRGGQALADIDRLMTSTGANIVKELKKFPDQIGILGTVLDARILHVDMVTALAVARQFGDDELHGLMRAKNMSTQPDETARTRLLGSELGVIMAGETLGTRKRGSKPGGGTQQAFNSLAEIARTRDALCNRAIGAAMVDLGLINEFEVEKDLGTELKFTSDLYCIRNAEPIRLEIMWRTETGRAAIANYVLGKLGNYGKAIGLLA
jgi:DNA (cytosine-5)-methyltransferase 1